MHLGVMSALFLFANVQTGFSSQDLYPQCDNTCYIDPCWGKECPANTGAKCVSRCCSAYFYDKYGNDITSRCDCPRGVKPHACKRDPCNEAACDKSGECRTDRCGGCDPVFYDRKANAITGCPIIDPNGGICPPLPKDTSGNCVDSCRNGCPRGQLCCSNGCGYACQRPYYPDCPDGWPLACKPPACWVRKCPKQQQAACRPTCFGCIPHFFDQFGNEVTENCECRSGEESVECFDDPCRTAKCPDKPNAVCRTNTCGACEAVFYDKRGNEVKCRKPEPRCPPVPKNAPGICVDECKYDKDCASSKKCCSNGCGRACRSTLPASCDGIRCIANACHVQTCHTHTQAECQAVCNTCFALFVSKFGTDITEQCNCPKSVPVRACSDDLCEGETCPGHPNAECRINSCGKCTVEFFDMFGKEVKCAQVPRAPRCPKVKPGMAGACVQECKNDGDCHGRLKCCSNGCGRVCRTPLPGNCDQLNCLVPACFSSSCARHTQTKCVGECNSCVALFFDIFHNDITHECNCPGRIFERDCSDNLCQGQTCRDYPDAECRINRCGGCNIEFFDRKGEKVRCDSGPKYDPACPAMREERTGTCSLLCSSNRDCPNKQICCSNGCGSQCKYPPQDDRCPPPDPKIIEMLPVMFCMPSCVDNDDCKGEDICCSDGCSRRCISPPFVDPRCETPKDSVGPCINYCNSNKDCGRKEMCCRQGCGTKCTTVPLAPKYDKRCPLPVPGPPGPPGPCVKMCSKNSDCRSDYMCCPLHCGARCTRKRRSCDPGEFTAKCRNVCEGRSCPNHPGARCRVHGCNGCKAEFYDRKNRLLKDCVEAEVYAAAVGK